MKHHLKEIAILIPTRFHYGQQLYLGISRFFRNKPDWRFHINPNDLNKLIKEENIIGLLCASPYTKSLNQSSKAIPHRVSLSEDTHQFAQYGISPNQQGTGKIAANYMRKLNKDNAVFIGNSQPFAELRYIGWNSVFANSDRINISNNSESKIRKKITSYLAKHHTSLAIFASDDAIGRIAIEAAIDFGLQVPKDIAVIGANNDIYQCQFSPIELSSVEIDFENIGYQGSAMLEAAIDQRDVLKTVVNIMPTQIAIRKSTSLLANEEPLVASAIELIQANINKPYSIDQLADDLFCSRRTLERKFSTHAPYSLAKTIRQLRLQHAIQLIKETNFSMEWVAWHSGFSSSSHMAILFKKELRQSPSSFRR